MLHKANLTSHSRMSGSRWVIIPSWLIGSWRSFLYIYVKHLSLIKVRTADPRVTLKFPFVSMCNKRYISKPKKQRNQISFWKDWFPRVVLSCSPFFWQNSHLEHGCSPSLLILPWHLSSTREGAQGGAPSDIQVGTSGLRRWCKLLVSKLYWYPT